jgi:hypothetical protein
MTAQIAENLIYQGNTVAMCTQPLDSYFGLSGLRWQFQSDCTALWRGYVGTWEIVDGRLYLIELHGALKDGTQASVATFFPDFPDRVFAHWYSGAIHIPQGKLLKYVHMGYDSIHERDLFLDVERGVVAATRVRHNGTSGADDAPEGYGIGGMTVFPRAHQDESKS